MVTKDSVLHRLAYLQRPEPWLRLVPWFNVLFVLLLAYSLAGLTWRLWPVAGQGEPPLLLAPLWQPAGEGKGAANLDAVAELHLFGEVSEVAPPPVEAIINAPETRLSLTLKGIVALSDGGNGRALIADSGGKEQVYKVGDALPGGASLHEVLVDRVILNRGGRFETLTLPRERASLGEVPTKGARTALAGQGALPNSTQQGTIQQQLSELRERIIENPQQAFEMVAAQPVMADGVIKGYRVSPGKDRRLFHGTGLRVGDVVTSMNGIALNDPAQMGALFEQLKSAQNIQLQVERGGRPTTVTINLGK